MKSIKPGRGPSMMSGVIGIFVALIGVLWTAVAATLGGGVFALFGIIFVVIAILQAVYAFRNATHPERYSMFDIVDDTEEPDPMNLRFGKNGGQTAQKTGSAFCPWCGDPVENPNHQFCDKCGKKLS